MNTVEIKGIVPGSGKTTTLIKLFLKSNLQNKIILTPSNKARQECIKKLTDFGVDRSKAEKQVKTMTKFTRNYIQHYTTRKFTDIETGEEIEIKDNIRYIRKESSDHFGKTWNFFIDEASMFTDKQIKNLTSHYKIQNLILDGDSLQFDPIGGTDILESEDELVSAWIDNGDHYNIPIDHQILLNENLRSKDEQLKRTINLIKEGKILEALTPIINNRDDLMKDTLQLKDDDWHVAYTNKKCASINSMYGKVNRWIVINNDLKHGFYKSEILENDCTRLKDLKQDLFYEGLKLKKDGNEDIDLFEEWKTMYLRPAYALTSHKLQGSSIEDSRIFVHLDDIAAGLVYENSKEDKSLLFQKFLYVGISRATSIKQLRVITAMGISKKGEQYCFDIPDMKILDERKGEPSNFTKMFREVLDNAKPLVDKTIKADAVQFSAKDEKLIDYLLSILDYSEPEDTEEIKAWKQRISEAHSVQHKQHKSKISAEFLELAKRLKENDWILETHLSRSSYQKARRIIKESKSVQEKQPVITETKSTEIATKDYVAEKITTEKPTNTECETEKKVINNLFDEWSDDDIEEYYAACHIDYEEMKENYERGEMIKQMRSILTDETYNYENSN